MTSKTFVAVIGSDGRPLMPCTGKRARLLLDRKRAKVHRMQPFTIQLLDRSQDECILQDVVVKIDPGSKGTGIAVAREVQPGEIAVLRLIELQHRGDTIQLKMMKRRCPGRDRRAVGKSRAGSYACHPGSGPY